MTAATTQMIGWQTFGLCWLIGALAGWWVIGGAVGRLQVIACFIIT